MPANPSTLIERAARRAAQESAAPLVVAVSGGLDSITLLHALARTTPGSVAVVATFNHRTGQAATRAIALVRRAARALAVPVVSGEADVTLDVREGREAAWREARYAFLRRVAAEHRARVATAHTEDDQIETVLMRVMRHSGARGLAALYADSEIVRPFLGIRRTAIEAYAHEHALRWIDDPSNNSRQFLRNRVRHDLLPALRRVSPAIDEQLLHVAREAAALRGDIDVYVDTHLHVAGEGSAELEVGARELAGLSGDSLMVLWGALAGRVGLSLDRRGTRRIGEFTKKQPRAGWIPLSGGWQLEARRGRYRLYRYGRDSVNPPQSRGNRSVRQTGTSLSL